MGLILIRLLIFVLVRICGFSLWIFPNLFEDVGILESFYPLYSFNSNVDGLDGKLSRILGLGFLIYFVYQC